MNLKKLILAIGLPSFSSAMVQPPKLPHDILRYLAPFILSSYKEKDIIAATVTNKLFHKEINNPAVMIAALQRKFVQPLYPYDVFDLVERMQYKTTTFPVMQDQSILACTAKTRNRIEAAVKLQSAIKYSFEDRVINCLFDVKNIVNLQGKTSGWTAIMHAFNMQHELHLNIIKFLLAAGADSNIKNNAGETVIHLACLFGSSEAVRLLLTPNANLDLKNNCGRTALMQTALRGNVEIAALLIDAGAHLDLRDNDGLTARDFAVKYHHHEIVTRIDTARKIRDQKLRLPLKRMAA